MKKKVISAFLLAGMLLTTSTYADLIDSTSFNADNNTFEVCGTHPDQKENSVIGIQLLKTGIEVEMLRDAENDMLLDLIAYNGESVTGESGKYRAVFKGNGNTGACVLRVATYAGGAIKEISVNYLSESDAVVSLGRLNSKDKATIIEEVNQNGLNFGIEQNIYNDLEIPDFADAIIDLCAKCGEQGATFSQIVALADETVLLKRINSMRTKGMDELEAIFKEFKNEFGNELGCDEYASLDRNNKSFIFDKLVGNQYTTSEEFKEKLNMYVCLLKLKNARHYTEVKNIINQIALMSNTEFSVYTSLGGATESVDKAVCSKWFESFEALKAEIKKVVDNSGTSTEGSSTGNKGGSGGGGGGGGGGTVITSLPKPNNISTQTSNTEKTIEAYSDMENYEWAKMAVYDLSRAGVISGYGNGEFKPGNKVTREEFVKIIIGAFDLLDESAECDFADVGVDMWYYKSIASAKKLGIINGMEDGSFGIGRYITRQEMATIAYRTLGIKGETSAVPQKNEFADCDYIDDYAKEAVTFLHSRGVVNGKSGNMFAPKDNALRAESAVLIYNLINSGI